MDFWNSKHAKAPTKIQILKLLSRLGKRKQKLLNENVSRPKHQKTMIVAVTTRKRDKEALLTHFLGTQLRKSQRKTMALYLKELRRYIMVSAIQGNLNNICGIFIFQPDLTTINIAFSLFFRNFRVHLAILIRKASQGKEKLVTNHWVDPK